ncbi:MAG: hypothetical protein JNL13_00380, partial [Chitinophagaceae bacterium]|nr:hypothetical protein [Chitinophagaceae bacterium]
MKATIKLRKILEVYNCTFTLDEEQQFEVFVATKDDDTAGVFTAKSFSLVVGQVYAWM